MALMKCPECGQSVSDKASKCPKCGYPIQEYLNQNTEKSCTANDLPPEMPTSIDLPENVQEGPAKKRNKKTAMIVTVACVVIIVAIGIIWGTKLSPSRIIVEDISINKWRLTDSTDYGDYYEGTITSEQKSPFIAVIGEYENATATPQFVYIEDGIGVIETYEGTDEDPSIKYRAIGYMDGKPVTSSDVNIKYKDSNYYDWSYAESTNCDVLIDIDMNNGKTGLLVFDIINETNNEKERNLIAVVINGKAEYSYYAQLPYKARGIDISIVPKLFCESTSIAQEDYTIEKAYTAEKYEGSYSNSYSGEQVLAFADYADGFVLYTRELKEGGNKENRNIVKNLRVFLCDGECTLATYDSVDEDETILMPKYEFNIMGYITWTVLEKETLL